MNRLVIFLALIVAPFAVPAEEPVALRAITCSAHRVESASRWFVDVQLKGIVHKFSDNSLKILFFESAVQFYGAAEDTVFNDFAIGHGSHVKIVPYRPVAERYQGHVAFPLSFGQSNDVQLLFPSNFKAHGDMTAYFRMKNLDDAYGYIPLECR